MFSFIRPVPNFGEPMRDRIPPNAWRPMSRLSPNAPIHGFGGQLLPMSGGMAMPMNSVRPVYLILQKSPPVILK